MTTWQTTSKDELDRIRKQYGPKAPADPAAPAVNHAGNAAFASRLRKDLDYYGVNPNINAASPIGVRTGVTPPVSRKEDIGHWSASGEGGFDTFQKFHPDGSDAWKAQYAMRESSPLPGLPPPVAPVTGAAGPTGEPGPSAGYSPWEAPIMGEGDMSDKTAGAGGATGFPSAETPKPAENAQQRWATQSNSTERYYSRMAGGSERGANRVKSLMARRIAPGPGNIPGYGTPSARNGSPGPVKFKNSPNDWSPY